MEARVGHVNQSVRTDRHAPRRAARALLQVRQKLRGHLGANGRRPGGQQHRTRQAGLQDAATGYGAHRMGDRWGIGPQRAESSAGSSLDLRPPATPIERRRSPPVTPCRDACRRPLQDAPRPRMCSRVLIPLLGERVGVRGLPRNQPTVTQRSQSALESPPNLRTRASP